MRSDFCLRKTMGCKQRTNEGGGVGMGGTLRRALEGPQAQ